MWARTYNSSNYKRTFNYILTNQPCLLKAEVVSVMGELLGCSPSNMYYLLNKLTKAGFIENVDTFVQPTQQTYNNLKKVEDDDFTKFNFEEGG